MTFDEKKAPGGLIKILPESVLLLCSIGRVMLPCHEKRSFDIELSNSQAEIIRKDGMFIIVPAYSNKVNAKNISKVGTLGLVEKIISRGDSASIETLFVSRVDIFGIERHEEGDFSWFGCKFSIAQEENVSAQRWQDGDFQDLLIKFKAAFEKFAPFLEKAFIESGNPSNQSGINSVKAIKEVVLTVNLHTLSYTLDILGVLLDTMTVACGDDRNMSMVFEKLQQVLQDKSVEKRLQTLTVALGSVYLDLGKIKARFSEKDDESLPNDVKEELGKPLSTSSQEREHQERYRDYLRELPWNKKTEDKKDLKKVKQILDEDHWGLEEVKERILDFLPVRMIKPDAKAPILCFVGPPGVGKTSLGKSIARALGRKFVRESLGGVKDEAEIRGHRRTYVAALPGVIMQGLRRAQSKNPVFMLDEVDKLGEHGGDKPANALLEVLDPEQNHSFKDHYTEFPFDLSEVLFITTANMIGSIHPALLNRMEVIFLQGYAEDEKVKIAIKHSVPKVLLDCGIEVERLDAAGVKPFAISFSNKALETITGDYTHDAGMRHTEEAIRKIARKVLRRFQEGSYKKESESFSENGEESNHQINKNAVGIVRITPRNLKEYLGEPEMHSWLPDLANPKQGVGFCLVVDANGQGGIVPVEVSIGEAECFSMESTGNLGDVIEESVNVAISRLLNKGGVLEGKSHKIFVHTHFDNGATKKDGPSAGVVVFAAIYSALTGKSIKPFFAATGEITLKRNVVLPVGEIKAKLLAARKAGIREVAIPLANKERGDLKNFPMDNITVITPEYLIQNRLSWRDISKQHKSEKSLIIYCIEKPEEILELAFIEDEQPVIPSAIPLVETLD